jgi:hypothetical protein
MQNVKFSEKFLTNASQFGLHLDATPGAFPLNSTPDITVCAVLDLENVAVLIDNRANNVVLVDFAAQKNGSWFSFTCNTVEELADLIKTRRALRAGNCV